MRPPSALAAGSLPLAAARASRRQDGFSLTELLVVIGIALVVGAMGVPQVTAGVQRHRVQASASMVVGKLTEARINALKRNRPTWLAIDATTGRVQVQTTGVGGVVDLGAPGLLSEGVAFAAAPAQIDYDSMGRTTAVQAVQLASGRATRTVTIRLTGAATIQ